METDAWMIQCNTIVHVLLHFLKNNIILFNIETF